MRYLHATVQCLCQNEYKKKHGTSRIGNIRIVIKFIRCLKLIMTSQVDKKNKRNQLWHRL